MQKYILEQHHYLDLQFGSLHIIFYFFPITVSFIFREMQLK